MLGEGPGGSPPPAKMQHIRKELLKCTTLTHSELDDDSPLGIDTSGRIPSASGLDSGSEGAGSKHEAASLSLSPATQIANLPHFSRLCGHTGNVILSPLW